SYSTPEERALNVTAPGVLGNDTDVDGDALTAVLVAGPSHGALTLNPNGSFTYTPATAYTGPDSFTYKARDPSGALSSVATVSLTFPGGQTTQTITVTVNGDLMVESNETFFVNLSAPTNATLADSQGKGTIVNDDSGLLRLAADAEGVAPATDVQPLTDEE